MPPEATEPTPNAPTARASFLALGLALAVFVAGDFAIDAAGIEPAPLTGHHGSLAHYDALRALVAEEGPAEVVAIGSSVFRRAVIPDRLGRELEHRLGLPRPPRVYNFGAVGHNALTYPSLTELVLRTGTPRLIVYLIIPRSVDATSRPNNRSAEIVAASPYATAFRDPSALRRSLRLAWLDHVPLARFGPTLRGWLSGELDDWRPRERVPLVRGYFAGERREIKPAMRRNQREIAAQWRTTPRYAAAVDEAVRRARAAGSQVLLVDAPRPQALLALMDDPDVNVGGMQRFLREAGERLDVPVALFPERLIREEDYADLVHVLPPGAEIYTQWLAGQIAARVPELRLDEATR